MIAQWQPGTLKICGLTRSEDIEACVHAGADLLGLVLVADSRRRLSLDQARRLRAQAGHRAQVVGVFMNQPFALVQEAAEALDLDFVQLHGHERGECWQHLRRPLIRRVSPEDYRPGGSPATLALVDPGAGDGIAHRWPPGRYDQAMIAGGLDPANVAALIASLAPAGVDVSSGVECAPGHKSAEAIEAFCHNARHAFAQLASPLTLTRAAT